MKVFALISLLAFGALAVLSEEHIFWFLGGIAFPFVVLFGFGAIVAANSQNQPR